MFDNASARYSNGPHMRDIAYVVKLDDKKHSVLVENEFREAWIQTTVPTKKLVAFMARYNFDITFHADGISTL